MISTVITSSTLSLIWSELIFSLLAGLGGAIVFWGLRLENKANKEEYLSVADFRSSKLLLKRGEKWVRRGVLIEIILAILFAANEGWQIWSLQPRNRPIYDISAFVSFKVRGKAHIDVPHWGASPIGYVSLCQSPFLASHGVGFLPLLESEKYELSYNIPDEDTRIYSMRLQMEPGSDSFFKYLSNANAMDDIAALWVSVKFLPFDAEILGGSATVVVNNSIKREFTIPPQTAFEPLFLTNNPSYRDAFNIIAVFGTNEMPINRGPQYH